MDMRRAFITGISGLELSAAEREFIRAERPWGFILFKRNIDSLDQVMRLNNDLRETRLKRSILPAESVHLGHTSLRSFCIY